MSAGLNPTKVEIDGVVGNLTRQLAELFTKVETMQYYLVGTISADLEAKGYTPNEVALVKSAFTDLKQLHDIFTGTVNLASAKDFRTFVKQLWGLGAF